MYLPTLLSTLSIIPFTLALPLQPTLKTNDALQDVNCYCITFHTSYSPSLCTHMDAHAFPFSSAQNLISTHDIALEFTSLETIAHLKETQRMSEENVLAIARVARLRGVDRGGGVERENKIVCGFGDEVSGVLGMGDDSERERKGGKKSWLTSQSECHLIAYVIAVLMVIAFGYVLLARAWASFLVKGGTIKLEGEEKIPGRKSVYGRELK